MSVSSLSKSDFLSFRDCGKSFWLKKMMPETIKWPEPSSFDRLLMEEGYQIEEVVKSFVKTWPDADDCSFQCTFTTNDGLHARADLVRDLGGNTIDLWEIKSSTSLKSSTGADHVIDATFQTIVAEKAGASVRSIGIIHVDKDFIRDGEIDPTEFLKMIDVTQKVRSLISSVEEEIFEAKMLLNKNSIDETSCACLYKSKGQHCASFGYFNPSIKSPSIYDLPRLSKQQRQKFVADRRFSLVEIEQTEVTPTQLPVFEAMKSGRPVLDAAAITAFLNTFRYPLYFYDYETYGSAVPISDGVRPHEQIPVQVSVHTLESDNALNHAEILIEKPGSQEEIIEFLQDSIGPSGNLVSWNASFEKGCNRRLARLYPAANSFLKDLDDRTIDLMDIFKASYVHPEFCGSTSIKKVLPVICPHLQYDPDRVHDGAGAIEAWKALISEADENIRSNLRKDLLDYCELDTLAMVEIFRVLVGVAQEFE